MSLLYDANGDQIALPSNTPAAEQTIAMWAYASSAADRVTLWQHSPPADVQLLWRADLAGDPFQAFRAGATYGSAVAAAANFAHYGTGKWLAIVARFSAATSTLWIGDESNTPAGPSAYTTQIAYITPDTSSSGAPLVGGSATTNVRWWRNRIGGYAWWDGTALTDAEVGNWWADLFDYPTSFPTPTAFGRCGSNGTTNVPDDTGTGNTGTITALSSEDSFPAILFPATAGRPNAFMLLGVR